MECSQDIDSGRLSFAHNEYVRNIGKFRVMLKSSDPDHFKGSGALLHALVSSSIASGLSINLSEEQIESGTSRLHVEDGKHAILQYNYYCSYHNELLAFETAYRCCASYEASPVVPNWDYVQNVCFYLSLNGGRSLETYFMLFKSLMFR